MESTRNESIRSLAGLNFLFGLWLIVSPYLLNYAGAQARWEQTIAGIVVAVLAAVRYFSPAQVWASWINFIVGIWMIIAPYATSYNSTSAYWNEVIFGILIAVVAFGSAVTHHADSGIHHGTHMQAR